MDANERREILGLREIDAEPVSGPTFDRLNGGIIVGGKDDGAVYKGLIGHRRRDSIGETAFSMAAMSK